MHRGGPIICCRRLLRRFHSIPTTPEMTSISSHATLFPLTERRRRRKGGSLSLLPSPFGGGGSGGFVGSGCRLRGERLFFPSCPTPPALCDGGGGGGGTTNHKGEGPPPTPMRRKRREGGGHKDKDQDLRGGNKRLPRRHTFLRPFHILKITGRRVSTGNVGTLRRKYINAGLSKQRNLEYLLL